MNVLTAARQGLADLLSDRIHGLEVVAHDVDRPAPPQIVITPATPWVEAAPDAGFQTRHQVTLRVLCVSTRGKQTDQIEALEEMAAAVLQVLDPTDWAVTEISPPFYLQGDQFTLPATSIEVTTRIHQ